MEEKKEANEGFSITVLCKIKCMKKRSKDNNNFLQEHYYVHLQLFFFYLSSCTEL
jgi:hypothetical protein